MTEQKKLTRREAIKILGTATGAVTLANMPSKWSKPELAGGYIPAHAQTSNCPDGFSSMSVFIQGAGLTGVDGEIPDSESGDLFATVATGYTAFFDCRDECFGYGIGANANDIHVIITLNGLVVFDQTFNTDDYVIYVNGATGESNVGEFGIVVPPASCDFG